MNYGGIYRGKVVNNVDPENLMRVTVEVPAVYGVDAESGWAWPCLPILPTIANHVFTDNNNGDGASGNATETLVHTTTRGAVPAMGSPVWVMFIGGEEDKPVWLGTWLRTGD